MVFFGKEPHYVQPNRILERMKSELMHRSVKENTLWCILVCLYTGQENLYNE